MIPIPRPGHQTLKEAEDACVKAGVLLLFYPFDEEIFLVLTLRTDRVSKHQAQISFPGGRREQGEDIVQTALREAEEELGVSRNCIRILGTLSPLYIPPTNYCIFPAVAAVPHKPDFQPSAVEVADILQVPLSHLLSPRTKGQEERIIQGSKVKVPFYAFEGHKIWGATAMVLAELEEILRRNSGEKGV
jgi:8-oxo-dGTP pyrophosphatase MutT (NUDIX family)